MAPSAKTTLPQWQEILWPFPLFLQESRQKPLTRTVESQVEQSSWSFSAPLSSPPFLSLSSQWLVSCVRKESCCPNQRGTKTFNCCKKMTKTLLSFQDLESQMTDSSTVSVWKYFQLIHIRGQFARSRSKSVSEKTLPDKQWYIGQRQKGDTCADFFFKILESVATEPNCNIVIVAWRRKVGWGIGAARRFPSRGHLFPVRAEQGLSLFWIGECLVKVGVLSVSSRLSSRVVLPLHRRFVQKGVLHWSELVMGVWRGVISIPSKIGEITTVTTWVRRRWIRECEQNNPS